MKKQAPPCEPEGTDHLEEQGLSEFLVAFKSGHYKKFRGWWLGDSVWNHCKKEDGTMLHFNKEEIEYIEVSKIEE